MLDAPELRHLCDIIVDLAEPIEMGQSPKGRRRIIRITGGKVEGDRLRGRVLNLGADWQTVIADGFAELDARYALETHDGAIIEIRNFGYRRGPKDVIDALARGESVDPKAYYMRTTARFETADARYDWLNGIITVGTGVRDPAAVRLSFYEVL